MLPVLNAAFSLWRIHLKKYKTSSHQTVKKKSKVMDTWHVVFPKIQNDPLGLVHLNHPEISPSFPTIAAYPVDLPNAGVALSNLRIFQMRCCQHREMFKNWGKNLGNMKYLCNCYPNWKPPNSYGMEVYTWKCTVDYQQNNYQVHSITNMVSSQQLLWCHALNSKSVAMGRFCFHHKTMCCRSGVLWMPVDW